MELYLAQHGKATSKDENPERPLTEDGREETRRVAHAAVEAGVQLDAVWHSGKLRARQTAEIFAGVLLPDGAPEAKEWLGALDDPREAIEAARKSGGSVLLVGHLPYMSRLPSLVLAGDPERGVVEVRYSGVIALGEDEEGWMLRWYLRPELLAA